MRQHVAILLLFLSSLSCATIKADVKSIGVELKADASACAPVAIEEVHAAMPLLADYAICMAYNKGDASQCEAQQAQLVTTAKADAIQCGLAMIGQAEADAQKLK